MKQQIIQQKRHIKIKTPKQFSSQTDNNNQQEFQTQKEQYLVYNVNRDQQQQTIFINHNNRPNTAANTSQETPKLLHVKVAPLQINQSLRPKIKKTYLQEQQQKLNVRNGGNIFDRNFQSGNLEALQSIIDTGKQKKIYKLRVGTDSNSFKQSQWFYFSIKNIKTADFIIVGFKKKSSLYNQGMKICINQKGIWKRGGTNISYQLDADSNQYCLKFSYTFLDPLCKTYFAYCFPYTYSDLEKQIFQIQKKKLSYVKCQSIAKSLLQNNIYCINIGNGDSKQVIVITARVHPGQSVSSFLSKGFVQKLISSERQMEILRDKFLFKIFPMINPDGVILGNYRFSYSGNDLNRKWKNTDEKIHPQIYHLKKLLQQIQNHKKIIMILDLHGHSRKKNVFFYGCNSKINSIPKQFPFIMSRIDSNYSYTNCNFAIQKSKEGTQRISMYNMLHIPWVYTIESSFCGKSQPNNHNFSIQQFIKCGSSLCLGLAVYLSPQLIPKIKSNLPQDINIQKLQDIRKTILNQFYQNKNFLNQGNSLDDEGSDSAPSQGCYQEQQIVSLLKKEGIVKNEKNIQKSRLIIKDGQISNMGVLNNKKNQNGKQSIIRYRPLSSKKPIQLLKKQRKSSYNTNNINEQQVPKKINQMDIASTQKNHTYTKQVTQLMEQYKNPQIQPKTEQSVFKRSLALVHQQSNHNYSQKDKGTQYKRIKNYAQKMMRQSKQKKQRSLQLQSAAESRMSPPTKAANKIFTKQDFRILKINHATFNLNCITTPIFKKKVQQKNNNMSYFNVSIKARDYLAQKKNKKQKIPYPYEQQYE